MGIGRGLDTRDEEGLALKTAHRHTLANQRALCFEHRAVCVAFRAVVVEPFYDHNDACPRATCRARAWVGRRT
jgi:hypothetical protein